MLLKIADTNDIHCFLEQSFNDKCKWKMFGSHINIICVLNLFLLYLFNNSRISVQWLRITARFEDLNLRISQFSSQFFDFLYLHSNTTTTNISYYLCLCLCLSLTLLFAPDFVVVDVVILCFNYSHSLSLLFNCCIFVIRSCSSCASWNGNRAIPIKEFLIFLTHHGSLWVKVRIPKSHVAL